MSTITLFVQVQGDANLREVPVPAKATTRELLTALTAAGVAIGDTAVFLDEAEDPLVPEATQALDTLKHGSRVHVVRCRRIKVTAHYLQHDFERDFPPGARVRAVKAWAVREAKLEHKDAAEHVLQLCKSTERPASDTPLHTLVRKDCAVCFDLVPEKRVEG